MKSLQLVMLYKKLQPISVQNELGHHIRVTVGIGSSVFYIALLISGNLPRDSNRCASIRNAVSKLLIGARLVFTCKTFFDAIAIVGYMEIGTCSESFGCCDTGIVVVPHLDGREIGVRPRSVPVTADRLRVKSSAHGALTGLIVILLLAIPFGYQWPAMVAS